MNAAAVGRTVVGLKSPIGAGVVAFVLFILGRQLASAIPAAIAKVDSLGPWAPVLFILGYAVAAVVFIPESFVTLAAGAVFGVWRGTLSVLVGATLGASAAFLISRYVARDLVARRLTGRTTIAAIDAALESDGLWITFLLRLSPLVPFGLLNYALGLTRVNFRDFLLASVGMIPGTLLYTYSGYVAGDLAAVAARGTPVRGPWQTALLVIGLIATLGSDHPRDPAAASAPAAVQLHGRPRGRERPRSALVGAAALGVNHPTARPA